MSMKNSSDTIGNRNRDLPICSAVPQPTAPPRVLLFKAASFKVEQWSNDIEGRNPQVVEKPVSLLLLLHLMQSSGLVTGYSFTLPIVLIQRTAIPCLLNIFRNKWLTIPNRRRRQASCHLLASNAWHRFFLRRHTSLGAMMDECVECHLWLYEVWCVPLASHVPYVLQGWSKVSQSRVFVTLALQILCVIKTKNTFSQIWLKIKFRHDLHNHGRINNYEYIKGNKLICKFDVCVTVHHFSTTM